MSPIGTSPYLTRIDPLTEEYLPHQGRRKVFISYKKTDNELTDRCRIIANKILRMVDCAIWYDVKLTPGKDYDNEIYKAICECDAVVLLLTENILESSYVWEHEVAIAQKQQKGIIPIIFDISKSDLDIAMERIGSNIQALRWPSGNSDNGRLSAEAQDFDEAFSRALDHFIVDADLGLSIKKFFDSELHTYSPSMLLPKQLYYMGFGYLHGLHTKKDVEKGTALLDSIVHIYGSDEETMKLKGDAAHVLHSHYYVGRDHSNALKYAEAGAALNHRSSLFSLGYMCDRGEGTERNSEKAVACFTRASDMGDPRSSAYLGDLYRWGSGVETSIEKAMNYYNKAIELGYVDAMIPLAQIYFYDTNMFSPEKAFALLNEASRLGSEQASFYIGNAHFIGLHTKKDVAKAVPYLKKAAAAGIPDALAILGSIYDSGDGVERDPKMVVAYYSKAAELGSFMSLLLLAEKFESGDGVPQDFKKAAMLRAKYNEWLHTADPSRGYRSPAQMIDSMVESFAKTDDPNQFYIGGVACLTSGSTEKAIELLGKAAEAGHTDAAITLGGLYYSGEDYGISPDIPEAVRWLTVAANSGNVDSAVMLAEIYADELDYENMLKWYETAAALGNTDAMTNIGIYYIERDDVTDEDVDIGLEWINKAADAGNENARELAEEIMKFLEADEEDESDENDALTDPESILEMITPSVEIAEEAVIPEVSVCTKEKQVSDEEAAPDAVQPAAPLTRREARAKLKAEKKEEKLRRKMEKAAAKAARKAAKKK